MHILEKDSIISIVFVCPFENSVHIFEVFKLRPMDLDIKKSGNHVEMVKLKKRFLLVICTVLVNLSYKNPIKDLSETKNLNLAIAEIINSIITRTKYLRVDRDSK